jgi:hypothetical protein
MATSHCPGPISKEDYKEIICRFLSKNAFKTAKNDPDIENTILNRFLKYDEISETKAKYLALHGASSAEHFYPLHHKEIRQAVAFYTAYLGAIGDLGPGFLADLRQFRLDVFHETPQIPLLRDYKKLCEEFGEYYTAFSTDKITVGTINFTSSTVLEAETHDFKKLSTAPNFPHYFRFMTGLVEAYAWLLLPKDICSRTSFDLFIQIVPDIMDYTNAVNDLLSFYKESIVSNERNNPVYLRAQQSTSQVRDVLCSLSREIEVYVTRIKASVSDDKTLLQIVDAYLQGYVGFHVSQPRYRLEELGLSLCDIQSNP